MRFLNRLTTTVIIVLMVAGPPVVAGWWLLHRWRQVPPLADVRAWLQDPPAESVVIGLVVTGAFALWLLTTVVVVRIVSHHVVRVGRRLRHLPLPTPAQATATSLAGTALLGLPAIGVTANSPDPAPPATAGQQQFDPPAMPDTGPQAGVDRDGVDRPGVDRAGVDRDGVDLPDGGWIPQHTAQDVAAMAGLFWLRRRQSYEPTTAPRHDRPPVLPAAATLVAAHPTLTRDSTAGTHTNAVGVDELPAGELTLTGTGAHHAARGLLVSILMTNTALGAPRAHVIITADDLRTLLGPAALLQQVPGLHVTDNPDLALDRLRGLGADKSRPPMRLATEPRVLYLSGRRPMLAHDADRPDSAGAALRVVVFDDTSTADNAWQVDSDGKVTSTHERHRRLCMIGTQTACDLLQFISQAHGLTPPDTTPTNPHNPPADQHVQVNRVTTPPARLNVLGECRLTVHGRTVAIRRSAAWQVLVLLAARRDGATAHHLIETVWPGLPPASITNRLYTTLSDLRTLLRPVLEPTMIVHHGGRYRLDPEVVDVDWWHQQAAARAASEAITTTVRHDAHRTLIVHRGELAHGHTWPWLAPLREQIREDLITAYTDLADELPPAAAIDLLHDAITVDPYNEAVHRRAIGALIAIGDHTAAARLYQTYTDRLGTAGLHPSSLLLHLAGRIATTGPPR